MKQFPGIILGVKDKKCILNLLPKIFCQLLLPFLLLTTIAKSQNETKPNIILIIADDLGWKDVGYAGSTFYRTPNIDRLAREGMRFSQAYSAACVCSPSRGAIFSGKNPARMALTSVWNGPGGPDDRLHEQSKKNSAGKNQYLEAPHRQALPKSEATFAEVLAKAGYATRSSILGNSEDKVWMNGNVAATIRVLNALVFMCRKHGGFSCE